MTVGYPDLDATLAIVPALVRAGAELVELGIPFSDPLADGPTIQAATQKALENGTTLKDCLAMTRELRDQGIETPVLLLSYINPILAYGFEQFVPDAVAAGVDGLILPDLPPEEAARRVDMSAHKANYPNIQSPGVDVRAVIRMYEVMELGN